MKNKRVKRVSGLIGLIFLLTCLLSSASPIFAAEEEGSAWDALQNNYNIMKTSIPESFDETLNPTDTDSDTPLLLCEESELLSFQSYDNQKTEKDGGTSKLYVADRPQNSTDPIDFSNNSENLVENLKESASGIYGLNGVQGVAFDPNKSGRNDHVAFVGFAQENINKTNHYIPYLVIYDAVNGKWSEPKVINASNEMDWIQNNSSTHAYQIKDKLSITAGDYDRDFHDTVVVFASYSYTDNDIFEFEVDKNLNISQISESSSGAALLHPKYHDYPQYFYDKLNYTGRNQISAQLETGDLNDDGVDDLVCLSWLSRPDKMTDKVFTLQTLSPYLNVALGSKGSGTVLRPEGYSDSGRYIDTGVEINNNGNIKSTNTMYAPGMTIGKFTAGGVDTVAIAGRSMVLTTDKEQETCNGYKVSNSVNFATVSLNGNGSMAVPVFTVDAIPKMNELTTHTTKEYDNICSSTLEAVAFDGLDTAEYLFFDGDIYKVENDATLTLVKAYGTSMRAVLGSDKTLWGDYGDVVYISSTAVGNFDGNDGFYETLYFTLMEKNVDSQDDYHIRTIQIYCSERDEKTNQATQWCCTAEGGASYKLDVDDKGDNMDQGLAGIVVAIDCDDDGMLLKYQDKACYYSDPEILAILQATPYFEELNDNELVDLGSTGISITEAYGNVASHENSYDLSTGLTYIHESDLHYGQVSVAYTHNWTDGWENSMSYSNDVSFDTNKEDQVILYRIPVYVYTYEVWDPDTKKFMSDEDHLFYSYVAQQPVYTPMSVAGYDDFAAAYNKGMAERTEELAKKGKIIEYDELTILSENDYAYLLGNSGDPYAYQNAGGRTISKNSIQVGHVSGESAISYTIDGEYTSYKSSGNGVSIATTQAVGENHKGGVEIETDLQWSDSSSKVKGSSVTYSADVGNILSSEFAELGYENKLGEQYNFTWKAKVYDTDIPGKGICLGYDNSGNPKVNDYVQIVGYQLENISSPPAPPKVTSVKYDEDSDSLIISWKKSEDAKHGYRVLLQTDPDLLTYEIVENGTINNQNITSFSFNDFDEDITDYVFAVQSIDEDDNFGLRSNDVTGTIPEVRATGRSIYSGSGEPQARRGRTGDYYVDISTGDFYRKNAEGWIRVGNLQNYDFKSTNNIISDGINIEVFCGSNVSILDQRLIESKIDAGKLKIEDINEDIKQKAMRNVLAVMMADDENELTEADMNIFLSNPDNKIILSSDINVLVKSADIVGAGAPYIEYMINAKVCAHIVSKEMGLDKTYYYQVDPSDFEENASIDMELPVCGKYIPESVVHMSNDGKKIYDIYTEDGTNQFVYDASANVVKFSVDHFSSFRINGVAGSNQTAESTGLINVNTGVIGNDQTSLCFAIVLLMLAGVTYFVFVKKRMEE